MAPNPFGILALFPPTHLSPTSLSCQAKYFYLTLWEGRREQISRHKPIGFWKGRELGEVPALQPQKLRPAGRGCKSVYAREVRGDSGWGPASLWTPAAIPRALLGLSLRLLLGPSGPWTFEF